MDNDTIEQLIGFGLIMLFGAALTVSPPFAEFVDRLVFSYLRDILRALHGFVS